MANQYAVSGTIDIGPYRALLDNTIDVMWMRRNKFTGNSAQFFNVDNRGSGNGTSFKIDSMGSALPLPMESTDTGATPYFNPATGYPKTFVCVRYKSGVRVTDIMRRTDRFDKVAGMITGQLKSGMQLDEYQRIAIFNAAFTGTAGSDSLPLCSNSHPQENPEAGTFDNLTTGALTGANLQAGRLLAALMTNEQGDPDMVMSQTLFGPEALRQKAEELITSPQMVEDDLNARTVLIRNIKFVGSPYLDLDSSTAWFLIGDRTGEEKGLHEVRIADWEIVNNNPANGLIVVDKTVTAIKTFGITRTRNIVGSTGT